MKILRNKKGKAGGLPTFMWWIMAIVGIGAIGIFGANQLGFLGEDDVVPVVPDVIEGVDVGIPNFGEASSLNPNAIDRQSDTSAVVAVALGVYESSGLKLYDRDSFNSTGTNIATTVGKTLNIYGGNASYYVEPLLGYVVTAEAGTIELSAHRIPTEANTVQIVRDDNGDALTAHGKTNTSDYNLTVGASETKQIVLEAKNNQADSRWRIGGICVGMRGNISAFEPTLAQADLWTEIVVPEGMSTAVSIITGAPAAGLSTVTESYDNCWALKTPQDLVQFAKVQYTMDVIGKSTDPSGAANTIFYTFLDKAWSESADGSMEEGVFQNNNDESVTNVGMSETTASPLGKQVGAVIRVV